MFKRLRWMAIGMGMGTTGWMWAKRRLRRWARSYSPPQVASRAANQARNEFRSALQEGREAMRQREAELRADLDRRRD